MPSRPWQLLLLSFLLLHTTSLAQPLPADSLVAPNGARHLRLWLDAQGVPTYTVTHGAERVQLVAPSRLGFVFRGGDTLQHGLVLERREQGAYDSTWTAVWGPQRHVRDHHRWLRWQLREATGDRRRLQVEFRVSDAGVAFRCVVPARAPGDSLVVLEELSELALPLDAEAWWAWADYDTQEQRFQHTPLREATVGYHEAPRSGGVQWKDACRLHLLSSDHTSLLISRILRSSILLPERLV